MRVLILIALFVPTLLASQCGTFKDCVACDSFLDSDENQACSWCSHTESCVAKFGLECVFGNKIEDKRECPLQIAKGFQYIEKTARKMMLISWAAYNDDSNFCLKKYNPEVKLLKKITVDCDGFEDTCSGFSAVSEQDKAIILSFRGTLGNLQLLVEIGSAIFEKKVPIVGGGTISEYFSKSFYAVWDGGLAAELSRMKMLYPTYELWVTGHSLGAGLAAIAANVIGYTKAFPVEHMKLITFGQPRVGDRDWVEAHDTLLPYNYRVTHGRDIVSHIPPENLFGYRHHRHEVWYNNNMTYSDEYVVCLSPEDKKCSDQYLIEMSALDHRFYFGIDVLGEC